MTSHPDAKSLIKQITGIVNSITKEEYEKDNFKSGYSGTCELKADFESNRNELNGIDSINLINLFILALLGDKVWFEVRKKNCSIRSNRTYYKKKKRKNN